MLVRGSLFGIEVVVAYADPNGQFIPFTELMGSANLVQRFPNLKLTSSDKCSVPYLSDVTATDMTGVFKVFIAQKESIMESDKFLNAIAERKPEYKLDVPTYRKLFDNLQTVLKYLQGEMDLKIGIPLTRFDNAKMTAPLVKAMNERCSAKTEIKDNVTKFRNSCEDELFVKVPEADILMAFDVSEYIPKMADIFVPYSDRDLNTMDYKKVLSRNNISIEEIDGSGDNVTSELYPEEKRFYNAMCILHKSLLEIEYPGKVEDCISRKISSKVFREYLIEFLIKVLTYHWNQHGHLPLGFLNVDDDSESESESSGDAASELSGSAMYDKNVTTIPIGDQVIRSVIERQFQKDIFFPINILIQCLRFGKKKPSKIQLFDDKSYFDLIDFTYSSNSGSYASYVVQKTPSGCNYSVLGLVEMNSRITDRRFMSENNIIEPIIKVPVGLICTKAFQGTNDVQQMVISFTDLIKYVGRDEDLTIEGIVKDDVTGVRFTESFPKQVLDISNNAKIPLGQMLQIISTSSDGLKVPYISESVRDAFMEFTAFNKKLSTLSLLDSYIQKADLAKLSTFACTSLEELKLKCQQYSLPPTNLLSITIGTNECRLVSVVNDGYYRLQNEDPYCNLQSLMKCYVDSMKMLDYYGDVYYMEETVSAQASQPVVSQPVVSQPVAQASQPNVGQTVGGSSVFQTTASQPAETVQPNVSQASQPVAQTAQPVVNQTTDQPNVSQASQPVATQPVASQPVVNQPVATASVNTFEDYLSREFFVEKEFADNVLISVVLLPEEFNAVNAKYEKLGKPFRAKNLGTKLDKAGNNCIIVGHLVKEGKDYHLITPNERPILNGASFALTKFKSTMVALLRTMSMQAPSRVKFTNREVFDYYCNIVERL